MCPETHETLGPAGRTALLRELESLRSALRHHYPELGEELGRERGSLALLRLLPGLSMEQWPGLCEELGLKDWLAVPMNGEDAAFLGQLERLLGDMAYQTEHDPLTGLANRRAYDRFMDRELERSRRARVSLSLAVLDLDDFKKLNDTYGHPCGDVALVETARRLLAGVRRYDLAARLGGEEFALVFPETGLVRAERIVSRILDEMRALRLPCAPGRRVTFSAGLVCVKGHGDVEAQTLLDMADQALYQAKRAGKDRVQAAPIPDLDVPAKATLVEANEKRFLFTGN
jgi:diguanylate cyclase (GGDEF)-like protein